MYAMLLLLLALLPALAPKPAASIDQPDPDWVELSVQSPAGTMYFASSLLPGETAELARLRLARLAAIYCSRPHVPVVLPCGKKHGKLPPRVDVPPDPLRDPRMLGAPMLGPWDSGGFLPPI